MVKTPRDIIIEDSPAEVRVALTDHEGRLKRFFRSLKCKTSKIDGIYLGRLSKLNKATGGGYVDLYDGNTTYLPRTKGLTEGQSLIVQIIRDEYKDKSAVVTATPILRGRYISLQPEHLGIEVERGVPKSFAREKFFSTNGLFDKGRFTIRRPCSNVSKTEIENEVRRLAAQWQGIQQAANETTSSVLLMSPPDIGERILRDTYNIGRIIVDDRGLFYKFKKNISHWPDVVNRIEFHKNQTGIFELEDIESQWLEGLDRQIYLVGGGRVTIDETEALTAIDVDSWKTPGGSDSIRKINIKAMIEIAHQVCLRNLAGLIVIDPISMSNRGYSKELVKILRREMKYDDRVTDVLGLTAGGLIEMTRQRAGTNFSEEFLATENSERCLSATCKAANILRRAIALHGPGRPTVVASADIIAEFQGMLIDALAETERRIGQSLVLRVDNKLTAPNIYLEV